MGAREHRSVRRTRERRPAESEAWVKLVVRAQTLEEDLSSERASKRLLAARSIQEKAELMAGLAKATEAKEGMEHLWRDSKLQLSSRLSEWEQEREVTLTNRSQCSPQAATILAVSTSSVQLC